MTVGELRKELEGVPDDAVIRVNAERTFMLEYGDSSCVDGVEYDKFKNTFEIDI